MPRLPQIMEGLWPRTRQQESIFAGEELHTGKLNDMELDFCIEHLGESPRVMDSHEMARGANPKAIFTVLDTMHDEPKKVVEQARRKMEALREYRKRAKERKRILGGPIDHPGLGHGVGQSRTVNRFNVDLSVREEITRGDWAADLDGDGEIKEMKPKSEPWALPCPWCINVVQEKNRADALRAIGTHIHHNHRGEKSEWNKRFKPLIKEDGLDAYLEAVKRTVPGHEPEEPVEEEAVEEEGAEEALVAAEA